MRIYILSENVSRWIGKVRMKAQCFRLYCVECVRGAVCKLSVSEKMKKKRERILTAFFPRSDGAMR